jgi:SAM-dependent methyltransferase
LTAGRTISEIAADHGFEEPVLANLFDYIKLRTNFLDSVEDLTATLPVGLYYHDPFAAHLLDQYVGAYGPCLVELDRVLKDPSAGAELADLECHAQAFAGADQGPANREMLQILNELDVERVTDVGCGTGGLLIDFAGSRPTARGWGLDLNHAAVKTACGRIVNGGLDNRLMVFAGDSLAVKTVLPAEALEDTQVIIAVSVGNAFFGGNPARSIVTWLMALRDAFPGRLLLLRDYYGRLGFPSTDPSYFRRGLLHDVAQLLTGQGVPPYDLKTWRILLDEADCVLIKAFEGEDAEVAHFLYLIQL